MNVVYITDIENLIKSKMEIDELLISNKEIDEKTKLEDFVNKYGKLSDVFFDCGKIIPFNLVNIYGNKYLFLSDENDDVSHLLEILNNVNHDLTKLRTTTDIELINRFGNIEVAQYFYIKGRMCMD